MALNEPTWLPTAINPHRRRTRTDTLAAKSREIWVVAGRNWCSPARLFVGVQKVQLSVIWGLKTNRQWFVVVCFRTVATRWRETLRRASTDYLWETGASWRSGWVCCKWTLTPPFTHCATQTTASAVTTSSGRTTVSLTGEDIPFPNTSSWRSTLSRGWRSWLTGWR